MSIPQSRDLTRDLVLWCGNCFSLLDQTRALGPFGASWRVSLFSKHSPRRVPPPLFVSPPHLSSVMLPESEMNQLHAPQKLEGLCCPGPSWSSDASQPTQPRPIWRATCRLDPSSWPLPLFSPPAQPVWPCHDLSDRPTCRRPARPPCLGH